MKEIRFEKIWKRYHLHIRAAVIGFAQASFILTLFYHSFLPVLAAGIPYSAFYIYRDIGKRREERQNQLNLEFREGLQGISAALNTGYSIENAFEEAEKDLYLLYGDNSVLVPGFAEMTAQIKLNRPVEKVLTEFSMQCGVEDICNFAEVFRTAKRTGGDLIAITRSASEKISQKIEVNREIQSMIAGKQMEVRIMNLVPLGIILYFQFCSPGFLDCLYIGTGRMIMTAFLLIYILAYKWSERISQIEI